MERERTWGFPAQLPVRLCHRRELGGLKEAGQAFAVSSHSRQWLLGPLDIQLWRLDSRLASLWIWRACLVMLQACSDSEDRCQSQTPPGHLPVSAEVSVTL